MRKSTLPLMLGMALSTSLVWANQVEDVTVDIWKGRARIESRKMVVDFQSDPLLLTVSLEGEPCWVPASGGWLYVEDSTGIHRFARATALHRRYRGFVAELITEDGKAGLLLVEGDTARHVRVEILPSVRASAVGLRLSNRADEHYYGLGDLWDTKSVDVRGYRVVMWDHTGTPDVCNYVPFFMSTKGYGMFVDCAYRGYFDFGAEEFGVTAAHFEAPNLSLHIWVGKSMPEILPRYLDLTGYPPMPPQWAFYPQKWRDEGTWDDVFDDVRRMREHGIPLGVVWLDRPWMQGSYGSDDFLFDEKRYPNAAARIAELHRMGIRLLVWACDFLTSDSRYLKEGLDKGYLITRPGGRPAQDGQYLVDFANPEAREWWKGIVRNALRLGVDGIKLDRGQSYPIDVVPPSGRDPKEMHNYHAYLMVKTYAEALIEERGCDFQFTPRAGWAGTQRWTMKWPGDMDSDFSEDRGLPAVVRAQMAASLTGFAFWGSDIGGYGQNLTKKCFVRWVQHGTFSPLMQMAGRADFVEAPFSWDQEAVEIYRLYAKLRVQMIPYILDMARKAHHQGVPIVRHLAWEWPNIPEVHSQDYEYLFGDDLLVAPVVTEVDRREVYLPPGRWVDFWDRAKVYEGPARLVVTVPLERIPLYIRQGSKYRFRLPK
ncbi:MAG: hypothetical protein ONB23_06875 [candidate division KSB1 bacterium]|nr:hypothetical protein [candidate division KSB1 bacterium]